MHPFDIEHRLQQNQHVFGFRSRQVKGSDHEILILFLLLLGIRADDQDSGRDDTGEQPIAVEQQIQRVFERRVLDGNGNRVVSDILIEDQCEPSCLGHALEDFSNSRIFETQRDRLFELVSSENRLLLFCQLADALQGLLEGRIEFCSSGKSSHRLLGSAQLSESLGLPVLRARFLQSQGLRQAGLMPRVCRLDRQRTLELIDG